jgi:leader peptidase (prepilin peptidase)/N-methyltransferase
MGIVAVVGRVLAIGLLSTAALTDLVHRRIYRRWSVAALASGLVLALLGGQWSHLVVAVGLFLATYFLWAKGGLGGGDVWLASYLGLVLGVNALLALLVGSAVGSVVSLVLIATRRLTWKDPMPLGLFWAVGGVAVLVSGVGRVF